MPYTKATISNIYMLKNGYNGKIYIGASVNPKKRLNQHNSHLRRNKHSNKALQKDFNFLVSIGKEDLIILSIIEENIPIRETADVEIKYIEKYNSIESGYNKVSSPYWASNYNGLVIRVIDINEFK